MGKLITHGDRVIAIVISKLMYERRTNNWVDLINLALYSIRTTMSRATLRTFMKFFTQENQIISMIYQIKMMILILI